MFHAYCSIGDVPIKFDVTLTLFDGVVKLRSHWGVASAQKFHVTLRKASQNEEWGGLIKEGTFMPNNISKWFAMEEKYKEEKEEESIEVDEDDIVIEKTPKKKNRKTKDFNPIMGKKSDF